MHQPSGPESPNNKRRQQKNAATSFRVCRVKIDPGFQTLGSGGIRNCVLNPACRIKNGLSEYRVAAETSGFSKDHWLTKPPGTSTMVQQAVRFVTANLQLFLLRERAENPAEADRRSQMFYRKNSGEQRFVTGPQGRHLRSIN